MARISTYDIDTVIHADDNVIGTDHRPGGAQETRLFPVSSLAAFINNDKLTIWPPTGGTQAEIQARMDSEVSYDVNAESVAPIVNSINADGTNIVIGRSLVLPIFTFNHGLNTRNVSVCVYETQDQITLLDGGATLAEQGLAIPTQSLPTQIEVDRVVILDENNVLIDFGLARDINAQVVIVG